MNRLITIKERKKNGRFTNVRTLKLEEVLNQLRFTTVKPKLKLEEVLNQLRFTTVKPKIAWYHKVFNTKLYQRYQQLKSYDEGNRDTVALLDKILR